MYRILAVNKQEKRIKRKTYIACFENWKFQLSEPQLMVRRNWET